MIDVPSQQSYVLRNVPTPWLAMLLGRRLPLGSMSALLSLAVTLTLASRRVRLIGAKSTWFGFLAAALSFPVVAEPVLITVDGTYQYTGAAPSPTASFTLSFIVERSPVVCGGSDGAFLACDPCPDNSSIACDLARPQYRDGALDVTLGTPTVLFRDAAHKGGLALYQQDVALNRLGFAIGSGVLFGGTLASPTLVDGVYAITPAHCGGNPIYMGELCSYAGQSFAVGDPINNPFQDPVTLQSDNPVLSGTITIGPAIAAQVTSTTSTTTTTIASTTTSTIHDTGAPLASGWNLVGTGEGGTLSMAGYFANQATVTSVWKWVRETSRWAFYAPSLDVQGGTVLADYAANKGYEVLNSINPGEGYWVNASQAFFLSWNSTGEIFSTYFQEGKPGALKQGWSLISIGNARTPSEFNSDIGSSPPAVGVVPTNITSLWAWDNLLARWYFYAPSLDMQGGTVLTDYITGKGYLSFTASRAFLTGKMGFWVNKP